MGSTTVFQSAPVGADSISITSRPPGPPNAVSYYSGTIDLSVGETEIITFDVTERDDATFGLSDFGTFYGSLGANSTSTVGNLVVDDENAGTFTYTLTQAEWVADGSPTSIIILLNGNNSSARFDLTITCFTAGSLITTPNGEAKVEDLSIGDTILTADGREVAVKWLGVQTVDTVFSGPSERLHPVCISAGALGGGLPHSDLTVTADHGMVFSPTIHETGGASKNDGLVINASALVNGETIRFVPAREIKESFKVYHVETEDHDVILANGAPTETFIDVVGRASFDNHQEYLDLYGVERIIPEMARPRVSSARLVPQHIKHQLMGGAAANGAAISATENQRASAS